MGAEVAAVFFGGICAIPALSVLQSVVRADHRYSLGKVLAIGLAPFLVLQLTLLIVWLVRPDKAAAFGIFATFTFLTIVATGGLRAWMRIKS